jgi:hypothetical protein
MDVAMIIVSIVAIFLVLTGRLTNAARAIQGKPLEAVNAPSGRHLTKQTGSTVEEYNGSPIVGSGYIPSPSLFGLKKSNITSMFQIKKYLPYDQPLFGASPAVMEWNYLFPSGSRFEIKLPGTSSDTYTVLHNDHNDKVNGEVVVRSDQSHGLIGYLHFSSLIKAKPGDTLHGGDVIGLSGWPLDPQFGNGVAGPRNAHLAVFVDRLGWNWLKHYE